MNPTLTLMLQARVYRCPTRVNHVCTFQLSNASSLEIERAMNTRVDNPTKRRDLPTPSYSPGRWEYLTSSARFRPFIRSYSYSFALNFRRAELEVFVPVVLVLIIEALSNSEG